MNLVIYLGLLVLDVVFSIVEGFLLATLWGWFIAPIFHLPLLSVPQAIGIALTVTLVTNQRIPNTEHLSEFVRNLVIHKFGLWSAALLIGSVVHLLFL